MQNFFLFLVSALFFIACSKGQNEAEVSKYKPVANPDSFAVASNTNFALVDLMKNDVVFNSTTITSIDEMTSQGGTITKNNDGQYQYISKNNFVGVDVFNYTICNEGNCSSSKVTLTVKKLKLITFNISSNLQDYYKNISFSNINDTNKKNLKLIIQSNYKVLSYGQRHDYLYKADANLSDSSKVVLMYTSESRDAREYSSGNNDHSPQTFNTEHVFPKSKLINSDSRTDLHHLRVCDSKINSQRSNHPFVDESGNYKYLGSSWFPGDEWKGDVARMVLYLNLMHGEDIDAIGNLELFLKWNNEDPVSDFEIQRNNVIHKAQGNRNPFVDNAYLVTLIYGGTPVVNKWK